MGASYTHKPPIIDWCYLCYCVSVSLRWLRICFKYQSYLWPRHSCPLVSKVSSLFISFLSLSLIPPSPSSSVSVLFHPTLTQLGQLQPSIDNMDDFAELALEGASTGIDNYEKVVDPLKEKVKQLPNPIKKYRGGQQDRDHYDDDDESDDSYDDYHSPRRSRTDRGGRDRHRDSRGGGVYVEESYERRSGRAKSAGRDGPRGGRGLDRHGRSKSELTSNPKKCVRLISFRPP